jgi:uncharacterized protein YkwD
MQRTAWMIGLVLALTALADGQEPQAPTKQPPLPSKSLPISAEALRDLSAVATTRPRGLQVVPPSLGEIWQANQRFLEVQNRQRARYGLAPLTIDWKLAAAAWVQAMNCAERGVLSHTGGDGSNVGDRVSGQGYRWVGVAENGAMQSAPPRGWPGDPRTPDWAVDGWMASPGHRANLLGNYADFGGAYTDAPNGDRYWFVVYARTRPSS